VFIAVVAFVVPIALASSSSALPGDTTTTTSIGVPSTTTSTTSMPTTSTTTSVSTTTSSTSTTQPTTTTASPPVNGEGVVVILENGDRILAAGAVNAQAEGKVLAQTGTSPKPVWLTGLACLVSGALALTFKRRRHLSLYTLRSKRS
jgi:hypothetical protein